MRLSKKTTRALTAQANRLRKIYETPDSEIDAIVDEIRESAKNQPKFETREDEIAYILEGGNIGNIQDNLTELLK